MQTETLIQIKQQIIELDSDSKKQLAAFLADEIDEKPEPQHASFSDEDRRLQIEWLKANRERYARKYVALSGSHLVADGATLAETYDKAAERGFPDAFVTYVFSESDEVFGGW